MALLRTCALVVPGALGVLPANAALWLDPNWALLGELEAAVVYDSNLTARAENQEDVFAALTPKLKLERRGSATRFELEAQVERTWFQDFTEYNSTDPRVDLVYEYPVRDGYDPRTHVDLHWGQVSTTNADLGRRVRSDYWRGRFDQVVFDTGRTVGEIRVDGRSTDYDEEDLNKNDSLALEARIGYGISAGTRLGLGYGHEWTRSLGAAGRGDTDGQEDRLTVRLLGTLLPKLSGSLETGVAYVSYTGAVERDDTAWIASANLTWQIQAATTGSIRASRYTDFSPEGATALRSEGLLEFSRELGGGFTVRAGGGVSRVDTYIVDDEVRRADAVIVTAGLAYQMTDRFSAELSERWTNQDEDRDAFDYERHLITGQINYHF